MTFIFAEWTPKGYIQGYGNKKSSFQPSLRVYSRRQDEVGELGIVSFFITFHGLPSGIRFIRGSRCRLTFISYQFLPKGGPLGMVSTEKVTLYELYSARKAVKNYEEWDYSRLSIFTLTSSTERQRWLKWRLFVTVPLKLPIRDLRSKIESRFLG